MAYDRPKCLLQIKKRMDKIAQMENDFDHIKSRNHDFSLRLAITFFLLGNSVYHFRDL